MESPKAPSSGPGTSFLGTFALVFLAIGALFAIDTFLAKVEQSEMAAQAARLFQEGQLLAQEGRSAESIARLRAALAISRDNPAYQLALADALLAANKLADDEALLANMLQNDATDGGANLLMARALARQGKPEAAEFYYHMAIYGQWPKDASAASRVQARFELIDLLVRQDNKKALLAELLPLQDEAPADLETRRRMAHLFLLAGSPGRAADIFRQILRQDHGDADAYAGLGEAEIALGNYRIAETNLQVAAHLRPGDEDIRKRLDLSSQVLALDPMLRGLGAAERYRRTRKLVELALNDANQCAGVSGTLGNLADQAGQALQSRVKASQQDDAIEANLDLAEKLWQARQKNCAQATQPAEEPLRLVLARDSDATAR
jgi:thioredoxin-like negative regulator of GroEL